MLNIQLDDSEVLIEFQNALTGAFTSDNLENLYFYHLREFKDNINFAVAPARAVAASIRDAIANSYEIELLAAALRDRPQQEAILEFATSVPLYRPSIAARSPDRQERLKRLIDRAYTKNPVPAIQRIATAILYDEDNQTILTVAQDSPGAFEAKFLPGDFQDPILWDVRKQQIIHRVCRIIRERNGIREAIGSGVLVKSDLVLTCFHVTHNPSTNNNQSGFPLDYACEFDFNSATLQPQLVKLAANPIVASSPSIGGNDYILLRLSSPPEGIADRGYEDLTHFSAPKMNEIVIVFQHPDGQQLRFTPGVIQSFPPNRVAYNANTEPGSSGGPCYNFNLDIVALHHYAASNANHGIPIGTILPDISTTLQ